MLLGLWRRITISRVVKVGVIGKMTSEQRLECHEGVSYRIREKSIPGRKQRRGPKEGMWIWGTHCR